MRVTIDHGEKTTGLVFKKHFQQVTLTVAFSQEELAIIRARKMEKSVILERGWPAHTDGFSGDYNLTVGSLMSGKPEEYTLKTPLEAKQYDAALKVQLKYLKEELDANATSGESSTFEL